VVSAQNVLVKAACAQPTACRLMSDEDGPKVAKGMYERLFKKDQLDLDDIPYALDDAVRALREQGVPAKRWALYMHMGG
jgi:hypothetical protein